MIQVGAFFIKGITECEIIRNGAPFVIVSLSHNRENQPKSDLAKPSEKYNGSKAWCS